MVCTNSYKTIVLDNALELRVDVKVKIVDSNAEVHECKIKKLSKKMLVGNIQGEKCDRIFLYADIENIELI